jgi:hypothetical protein
MSYPQRGKTCLELSVHSSTIDERLGLLQLNGRRKDRLTPDSISLWERLADYLAVALAKFRADEELQKSEGQFRTLADSILNLAWWANMGNGPFLLKWLWNSTKASITFAASLSVSLSCMNVSTEQASL